MGSFLLHVNRHPAYVVRGGRARAVASCPYLVALDYRNKEDNPAAYTPNPGLSPLPSWLFLEQQVCCFDTVCSYQELLSDSQQIRSTHIATLVSLNLMRIWPAEILLDIFESVAAWNPHTYVAERLAALPYRRDASLTRLPRLDATRHSGAPPRALLPVLCSVRLR